MYEVDRFFLLTFCYDAEKIFSQIGWVGSAHEHDDEVRNFRIDVPLVL